MKFVLPPIFIRLVSTSSAISFTNPTATFQKGRTKTWTGGDYHKWGYPQIIHFNGMFHYKPTILGYPHLWKPPVCSPVAVDQRGLRPGSPFRKRVKTFVKRTSGCLHLVRLHHPTLASPTFKTCSPFTIPLNPTISTILSLYNGGYTATMFLSHPIPVWAYPICTGRHKAAPHQALEVTEVAVNAWTVAKSLSTCVKIYGFLWMIMDDSGWSWILLFEKTGIKRSDRSVKHSIYS